MDRRDASPLSRCGARKGESSGSWTTQYSQYATVFGLPPDGGNTGRRGLLSKEDRYGFKLTVGSGSGCTPRILHHPIHQGQSDDVVLCALGVSQGRWLDHLAGVPQGQDCPPGSSVSPPPRHRFARCTLDGPGHPAARHDPAPPGAAQTATLSPLPEPCVSPTWCGAFLYLVIIER